MKEELKELIRKECDDNKEKKRTRTKRNITQEMETKEKIILLIWKEWK